MPEPRRIHASALDARDHGVFGQSLVLFNNGFEIWVLASEDVGEVPAVYCFHRWKYGNL